ncbi:hypothetical protein PAGU2638_27050 [Lysobacter sp. PAGU 2638]
MHRDRADAERVARAQDAQRDFAPVCDYDFVEHGWFQGGWERGSVLPLGRAAEGRSQAGGSAAGKLLLTQ